MKTLEQRDGVEVSIEAGYGWVTGLEPKGRNAHVKIRAEHLQQPVQAWVDTHDFELYERVRGLLNGPKVFYRVVVKRKDSVAGDVPLADVPTTDRVRDLEELRPFEDEPSTPAPPAPSASPAAPAPSAADLANPAVREDLVCEICQGAIGRLPCRRKNGRLEHIECPTADGGQNPPPAVPAAASGPEPADAGDDAVWRCEPCEVVTNEDRAAHEASPAHLEALERGSAGGEDREPGWLTAAGREATEARAAMRARALEVADGGAEVDGSYRCPAPDCTVVIDRDGLVDHLVEAHAAMVCRAADVPAPRPRPTSDGKRGPRIAEAKPWEPFNSDGSRNLGSYEVQAAEGTVLLAHDLLLERARTIAKSEGKPFAPPSEGQLRGLTRRLLRASDLTQAAVRSDGHCDRMDGSHTRARAAVRSALEAHPVPWGAEPAELDQWVADLSAYAAVIIRVSLSLVAPEPLP